MKQFLRVAIVAGAMAAIPAVTWAGSITVNATNGSNLSAQAVFDNNTAGFLSVTLTNTSLFDANNPAQVLTGVFFSLNTGATVTQVGGSALLNTGSTVVYDPDGQPAGGVVGGEWAYRGNLSQYGATSGISSSGLGIFGPGDRFPGPDLQSPASPNGVEYGLLPAGWLAAGDNGGLTGSGGLINNSVIFKLAVTGGALTSVGNVTFQYGTDLKEPHITPGAGTPTLFDSVPVPDGGTTIMLLGSGLLALGLVPRRLRRYN